MVREFKDIPKNKCAVVVESNPRVLDGEKGTISPAKAIEQGGEAAYTINLARLEGIETFCFEPPIEDQIEHIAIKFNKDVAFLLFAGRAIRDYSEVEEPDIKKYFEPYLERFKQRTKWNEFDYSFEHLQQIFNGESPNTTEKDVRRKYLDLYNPTNNLSVLNEASREVTTFRDIYIVTAIGELAAAGKSHIFVVYGSGHALTQKAALEYVLDAASNI